MPEEGVFLARKARVVMKSPPLSKTVKKNRNSLVLHGSCCWVTIKWEGLSYSDLSLEDLEDVRNAGIDYEPAMRAFFKREQRYQNKKCK
jgi:hypothetical protein